MEKYGERNYQLAKKNTRYNEEGKAVVEMNDEWREENEWDNLFDELKLMPHYDSARKNWTIVTQHGMEEGDAIYIASEIIKGGLYYPFHSEPSWKEQNCNHAYDFSSVVEFLLQRPYFFSIEGFEEYYSPQEQELLNKLKMKLHIPNEETLEAIEDVEKCRNLDVAYESFDDLLANVLDEEDE